MATIYELIAQAENELFDEKAKEAGFVIGLQGELYTLSIGRHSAIYIERIAGKWIVWRETYQRNRIGAISTKTITETVILDYALKRAKMYLSYLSR